LGDHTETLQVDFDPVRLSYSELLNVFWRSHNPTRQSRNKQYQSVILFHAETQRQTAIESKAQQEQKRSTAVLTEITPLKRFYLAEEYHQKYSLRYLPGLLAEYTRYYPAMAQLIQSTAVTRVNGYLGGNGTVETLEAEIASYGLSALGVKTLREHVHR
jgi:peptide-methionine (S)-S-oxide reductase